LGNKEQGYGWKSSVLKIGVKTFKFFQNIPPKLGASPAVKKGFLRKLY